MVKAHCLDQSDGGDTERSRREHEDEDSEDADL